MLSDGTIIGRHFLELPSEEDSLEHALGKIRNAQRHGARKMPGLWALAKGINKAISIKTARFVIEVAFAALCGRDRHGIPGFPWKKASAEAAFVESAVRTGNGHGQGTPQWYAYSPCLRVEYVKTGI